MGCGTPGQVGWHPESGLVKEAGLKRSCSFDGGLRKSVKYDVAGLCGYF